MREKKLDTYVEFIRIADALSDEENFADKISGETTPISAKIIGILTLIDIMAPKPVIDGCRVVRTGISADKNALDIKEVRKDIHQLIQTMRDDIHRSNDMTNKL